MQGYNCIMVFHKDKNKLLFCKRTKEPYLGLYNLVGGKIEKGEDGYKAAYRELREETGITKKNIQLFHMMDFTYYNQDCYVEVYAGYLKAEVVVREEVNPLEWLEADENFFDQSRFAGEGNIGHMVEQVKSYGLGVLENNEKAVSNRKMDNKSISIGVDGCKGGWIGAVLNHGILELGKFTSIKEIMQSYGEFNCFFIDMIIGIPSRKEHCRPESFARNMIKERASTIFPAPCRQAVYAESVAKAYEENEKILGKKFTPLTVGIIPKIRELDIFLQENPQYKNVIKESHPEVCFARLKGSTVLTKKKETDGIEERILILTKYITGINNKSIEEAAVKFKCNKDDIIDAICLAVAANLAEQGNYEIIPEVPMEDETGLKMQLVIPK